MRSIALIVATALSMSCPEEVIDTVDDWDSDSDSDHETATFDTGDVVSTESPVYIWLYAHHYLGGGGIYPRGEDVSMVAETVADFDVSATLFFDGILMQELLNEPGGASRIQSLTEYDNLDFGYHGEETHGPYPIPASLLAMPAMDMTRDLTWDDAFTQTQTFAETARVYCLSDDVIREVDRSCGGDYLMPEEPGGVGLVQSSLGKPISIATYHQLQSPPVGHAFNSVAPVKVLQATPPVVAHTMNGPIMDNFGNQLMALGGTQDVFWYGDQLSTKQKEDAELGLTLSQVQSGLNGLDRTYPRYVALGVLIEPGDPTGLENTLTWITDEWLPQNTGSRFIMAQDLVDLAGGPPSTTWTADEVDMVASEIAQYVSLNGRVPDYVWANDRGVSLTDAWEMLARSLAAWKVNGQIPIEVQTTYISAPIDEASDFPPSQNHSIRFTKLVTAVAVAVDSLPSSATSSQPEHIPTQFNIGMTRVGPGEQLSLMASAWNHLRNGGDLTAPVQVNATNPLPPYSDLYDEVFNVGPTSLPVWYAKLQLWKVKPATLE